MSKAVEAEAPTDAPPPPERVRIWDGPTRIFHWLLVLMIPALWWTAKNDRIEIHVMLGVIMAGLLLFRLIWGLIGSSTARFANFLKGPRAIISYLNGRAVEVLGHNPIGGWSVFAMIAVLMVQVGLGLFAEDNDGLAAGPLSIWLDADTVETITDLHEFMFNVLLALIGLHLAAILFYALVKRRNLIGPMIAGRGSAPGGVEPMRGAPVWRLVVALLIAGGVAWWLWARL